jgi:hypothetical protein
MTIERFIINTVKEKRPETVEELVQLVQKEFSISNEEAMKHIIELSNKGKLRLEELSVPSTPKSYIFSMKAAWYWTTIFLALATSLTVFTIPENAFPIVYTRYLLGSIFVLFLPGFCLIKALFPQKELDRIERVALSIVMSLTIVPLTNFLLNYTEWGITTTSTTLSLLVLTTVFATVAVIREHQAKLKEGQQHIQNTSNCK